METTFMPVAGFENVNEYMQMNGKIPTLYVKIVAKTIANSDGVLYSLCCPIASIVMIIVVVIKVVNKSHKMETNQKIGNFAPLAYCMNRACV